MPIELAIAIFVAMAPNDSNAPIAKRRQLSTEERAAIWETYGKRCPYTGDVIAFSELEIDHIVPITISASELTALKNKKIIPEDFDLNSFSNLLPTKRFQNGSKSDKIRPESVLVHFLDVAAQHRDDIRARHAASIKDRDLLSAYLLLKIQAERNSLDVEDVVDVFRQREGTTRLRHAPELADAADTTLLNAALARELMMKPFALGGGHIGQVVVRDDENNKMICTNCAEFLAAKQKRYWPETQFDINCYGMAERNCTMLTALEHATYAPESVLRFPRVTCRNFDRWSSDWIKRVWIEFDEDRDGLLFARCRTIAEFFAEGACSVADLDDWRMALEPRGGFALALSELFRADLDGDGREEILVFHLAYATDGTYRAGGVSIAKPDADGILQPVSLPAADQIRGA